MSNAINIADEVAQLLATGKEAGTLAGDFSISRKVLPRFLIKELSQTKISVLPKTVGIETASREASEFTYDIEIGIQKKVSDIESEAESLIAFVDSISKYLRFKPLINNLAAWVRASISPIYSIEHLSSDSVFTSILTVSYKKLE
jgi:hypothetical protein